MNEGHTETTIIVIYTGVSSICKRLHCPSAHVGTVPFLYVAYPINHRADSLAQYAAGETPNCVCASIFETSNNYLIGSETSFVMRRESFLVVMESRRERPKAKAPRP